tara:strand:- start:129 stop:344 length:216 start_codon:yes stop_codon:yes gene_type:complete
MDRIKEVFNRFDRNKNGSIDKKELGNLAIALNNPLSVSELHDFFQNIDTDQSGCITWDEFIAYWSCPGEPI